MNDKNTSLIATIATAVLCGCPGAFLCLFGALTAAGQGTFNNESLSPSVGVALVCVALILLLIPVGVWFATRRRATAASLDDRPIPPVAQSDLSPASDFRRDEPPDDGPIPPAA